MLRLFVLGASASTNETRAASGNETNLLSGNSVALARGSVTNVLMITTTVGMLDGVHRHTTHLGPALALDSVLVVAASCLEHRLVEASASSDDANNGAGVGLKDLLSARGKPDGSLSLFLVVGNDRAVVARGLGDLAAVTSLRLDVANDGTFRHSRKRHHVTDGKLRLGAAVHKLTSVHAFGSHHHLLVNLVPVRVAKVNAEKGGATTRVVDHLAHNALDVSIALSVVERAELGGTLAVMLVRLEDGVRFTLRADNASHFLLSLIYILYPIIFQPTYDDARARKA